MINISEYMLPPIGLQRDYLLNGTVIKTLRLEVDGFEGGCAKYKLRDYNVGAVWNSDWLLRVEADGSVTEYGDQYPPSRLDWPRSVTSLIFTADHCIRWAEDAHGSLRPNPLKTSPSKLGSFGTYLCKAMMISNGSLNIYMEQKFSRTDRCLYQCRKGYGIYAITYYADNGSSQTISAAEGAA